MMVMQENDSTRHLSRVVCYALLTILLFMFKTQQVSKRVYPTHCTHGRLHPRLEGEES